jgi:hypothetical protein
MNPSEPEPDRSVIFERAEPGWWRVSGDFPDLYVGGTYDARGRVVITHLVLMSDASKPLDTTDLRRVPLGRLAAALNQPRRSAWVKGARPIEALQQLERAGSVPEEAASSREPLGKPSGDGNPEFYARVATAYRNYSEQSNRPAVHIAAEAGVPAATARRWINEARKRGLLEPGQRGRAKE